MPAGVVPARQPAPSAARQSSSGSGRAMGGRRRGPGSGPARSRHCSLRCGAQAVAGGAEQGSRPGPPLAPPAAGRASRRGQAGGRAGPGPPRAVLPTCGAGPMLRLLMRERARAAPGESLGPEGDPEVAVGIVQPRQNVVSFRTWGFFGGAETAPSPPCANLGTDPLCLPGSW